ncbi:CHASE domain-containing protein [Montanilutibacter psychrotolerans]|nr:CHASE domain-containing protein [Lysobacter psychrotolerans]
MSPDEPIDPTSSAGDRGSWRGHVLALAVLVGTVMLVLALWRNAYDRELVAAQAEFVVSSQDIAGRLQQRMLNCELVARGGGSLFASLARPTPTQWRAYATNMQIELRFPGMVGLGFAAYVPQSRLAGVQLDWRDSGYGMLEVWPRGLRPVYGPILYLEPRTSGNAAVIGYDMYAEPARRAAMEAAMETGTARLTAPVGLVQNAASAPPALLLYVPIYRAGDLPMTVAARRESMQGWVYVPVQMTPFVRMALRGIHQAPVFRITDVTDGVTMPVYETSGARRSESPAFFHHEVIEMYGRRWRMDFASPPLDRAAPRLRSLQNTLALGLFAALLMYAIAWVLARTEARALAIATRLTEDYRRSELRFRTAMQYSAIGKALLDGDGCIVEANQALGAIVAVSPSALVGVPFETLFEHGDGDNVSGETDENGVHRTTRRLHRGGGEPRDAHLTYAPLPGNIGQDIAGLVQVEDVTERLRAEARVHSLNRTLEARVALRTRELSLANYELETFAYSVSHDLRAPLRAIDGFSRVLAERYADRIDEDGRGYLGRVRRAAARMGELIDALLQMTRVSRSDVKPVSIDMSRLAEEVVDELRAGDPQHQPQVVIAPGMGVDGDAVLLRNLLGNLLGNAWKFTRGRSDARIEFGRQQVAGGWEFFVRDNGAGFDQVFVDKLFRPFQRLHGEEEFTGHGIGLATVKRIVERHGGTIRAVGQVGEGAAFYFVLPTG